MVCTAVCRESGPRKSRALLSTSAAMKVPSHLCAKLRKESISVSANRGRVLKNTHVQEFTTAEVILDKSIASSENVTKAPK